MQVSPADIEKYMEIYKAVYGVPISYEEAQVQAERLLRVVKTLQGGIK